MTTTNTFQLIETERNHRAPITPPAAYDVTAAALRLAVCWLRSQPGWQLVEHMDGTTRAYATFRTADNTIYGLSVTDTTRSPEPPMDHPWLVRVVPVILTTDDEDDTADYVVGELDQTQPDALFVDEMTDGYDVATDESAGV